MFPKLVSYKSVPGSGFVIPVEVKLSNEPVHHETEPDWWWSSLARGSRLERFEKLEFGQRQN